jgi:integral membrane protein
VNAALIRFRVMAWIVGVMLILVTAATIWKYWQDEPRYIELVGPPHGFLYVLYLVTVVDLAFRLRWSVGRSVLVCLAGTVPFLSFVAEHGVTREVRASVASSDAVEPA